MNETELYCPTPECDGEVIVRWTLAEAPDGDWIDFDAIEPDCDCPVDGMYEEDIEASLIAYWTDRGDV